MQHQGSRTYLTLKKLARMTNKEQPQPPKKETSSLNLQLCVWITGGKLSLTTPAVSAVSTAPKQNVINMYFETTSEGPANTCFQYGAALLQRLCCNVILKRFDIFCSFNLNHVQLGRGEYLRVCRVIVSFNGTIMYTQSNRNRI